MSSRALKKLRGEQNELELLAKTLTEKTTTGAEHTTGSEEETEASNNRNIFALALQEEDDASHGENDDEIDIQPRPSNNANKKKKKKKNKNKKVEKNSEEDIDALLAQVNQLPTASTVSRPSQAPAVFNPLSIQLKNLNPEYEMKRRFGHKVVGANETSRRRNHKTYKRSYHLVTPANNWQPITKAGLEMSVVEQQGETYVFKIEHKHDYQLIQHKFWEAVDSMAPENLMAVLQLHPYHIDTLLQLSEVCRMSEDPQMAAELIERALYAYESCFHPLFNMSTGKCVLKYKVWENRGLFLALFRHIHNVGNRGCYRTSLEYCKLLLSLDPDEDPLCVFLMMDFYALRSDEFEFLIKFYELWDMKRNLRLLPNFAYSVALAMFHTSRPDSEERSRADDMLQHSLMMYPGVLVPLLDACGVNTESDVNISKYFGNSVQYKQPASLKQLVNLYVGRASSCWKAPECIAWLEENVKMVCTLGDSNGKFSELTEKGRQTYRQKAPLNICRHLMMSDVKNATADLPAEVTNTAVLSYDPLPPADTERSYTRRDRRERQISNQGFLSAFINSLRPDFDVNALANQNEEAAGAAGGQGLREAGGNVMNAIRELLNNIEFAPPERDDEGQDDDPPQDWD